MLGMLKLAAYGLLGYAMYEFCRGVMNAEAAMGSSQGGQQGSGQGGGMQRRSGGGQRQFQGFGDGGNMHREASRANMTGPGVGVREATQNPDGGSVAHTVGRGVV